MTGNMNNPAGRLRWWINRFDTYPNGGEALTVGVARITGVEPNSLESDFACFRLGSQLADTCHEVRVEAARLPDHFIPSILLADFGQVEQYVGRLSMADRVQVQSLRDMIDPAARRGLEVLDLYLSANRPQSWIDEEQRDDLRERVRELIDLITANDDLDAATKQFTTARLADVETALRNAYLTGTPGIEKATDALIGSFNREPGSWQRVWEGALGNVLGSLVIALAAALGPNTPPQQVLPPAAPPISISTGSDSHVDVEVNSGDDEVVDAEIVDDGG